MKGKLLHADFMRVSRKTMLKVTIPFNFLNEEDCVGVKTEGGVVTKTMRDIEILCSAENIPEIIEVDIAELNLGDSIRLTDLSLPEGSEIPGLTEETDQMVVSVNAPKAVVEEEPLKMKFLKETKMVMRSLMELLTKALKNQKKRRSYRITILCKRYLFLVSEIQKKNITIPGITLAKIGLKKLPKITN